MSKLFDRSTRWIVDQPLTTTLLVLVITAIAIVGYVDPDSVRNWFQNRTDDASTETPKNATPIAEPEVDVVSLTNSHAILVVESDQFFTSRGVEAMRHVVEELESLDYVQSILWLDRVPIINLFGLPEPLFPRGTATDSRYVAAKQKALDHPLVAGQLLSDNGRTLLLMLRFDFLFVQDDDQCITGLREAAEKAAESFPDVELSFSVTGRVPIYVTAVRNHESNRLKYQIIGYSMIAIMAVILFRGISAVIVVAIAPALGVFWTLGLLNFLELRDNPFIDVVLPVLLSLVGLTDGVHLMVHIRKIRASGVEIGQAVRTGLREVGLACALTSLTTAIGFGSLSLAHHEVVRDFGFCSVIGVLLTFVAVITSIPLACLTFLGRRIHVGHEQGIIDRNLERISGLIEFVLKRQRLLSAVGIGVTMLLIAISLTLRPDERNANALPTHSEPAIALRKMDRDFGGLEQAEVQIEWSDQVPSDSREILDVVREIDDLLRAEKLIGHPLSIRNLIDAFPGDRDTSDRMTMLELLPPPLKRAFYSPERREANVSFRVRDLGIAKYGAVFERTEARLREIESEHPEFNLELSGSAVWRWKNLYQIVVDLAASLGTAAFIIFVVLSLVYRSLRIGLISIVPNLFPLALAGTYLALTGQSLEIVSVCAFTVCLGIAVDDTIHFLTRFEEERSKCDDHELAIRRAFTGVGTALIMTTVVLVAGFSTVMFSDSRDHRIFASMGGITIASALLGDLFFLPALLGWFGKKKTLVESDFRADEVKNRTN